MTLRTNRLGTSDCNAATMTQPFPLRHVKRERLRFTQIEPEDFLRISGTVQRTGPSNFGKRGPLRGSQRGWPNDIGAAPRALDVRTARRFDEAMRKHLTMRLSDVRKGMRIPLIVNAVSTRS